MCGIAGIVAIRPSASPPSREALLRMIGALHHRGPDERGLYRDDRAGLGHTRLSIIDLASGQQPMSTADGQLHVVFNGEIYNYVELREELLAAGHRFRTSSDTEVILEAYRAWGEETFSRLRGQWAIALWDSLERRLVLCRDRYGIRPLYLAESAGQLLFASEVKALFAAGLPRAFDPRGLDDTFTFWGPIAPTTVFEGIEELPSNTLAVFERGVRRERRYWRPELGARDGFEGSIEEATIAVTAALRQATALRLQRSDVTVGTYLSGGLDSSLVTALANEVATDRLRTFSLRFEDAEYDETSYQRTVAEHLGTRHEEVVVSRRDIAESFPETVFHGERPILRTAPTPMMLLSRLVRDAGIKVVLTGEGADEMFAGYDLFREGVIRRFWARQPDSELRPRLLERLYPYLARSPVRQLAMAKSFFGRDLDRWREPDFTHGTRWRSTAAIKRLFSKGTRARLGERDAVAEVLARLPEGHERWPYLERDQHLEIETLMTPYILSSQGDRMLMASSVEGRFPFLDEEVAALAHSLPPSHKLRVLDEKHVLKRAGVSLLPERVLARTKQPYRAPDALTFVGEDRPAWVDALLSEANVERAGVFAPGPVARLFQKCRARAGAAALSNTDNMALVGVLSTMLLDQRFIQETPNVRSAMQLTVDADRLAAPSAVRS
jgi:asparagine synthase (glutamine-hydrolysing)